MNAKPGEFLSLLQQGIVTAEWAQDHECLVCLVARPGPERVNEQHCPCIALQLLSRFADLQAQE